MKSKSSIESTVQKAFIKSICKICFQDHTKWNLDWPPRQYHLSTFIPGSNNQMEWPAKQVLDKYLHDFDHHKCDNCVQEISPWKNEICADGGVCTKFGQSALLICKNNLKKFGELPWWEKFGIP